VDEYYYVRLSLCGCELLCFNHLCEWISKMLVCDINMIYPFELEVVFLRKARVGCRVGDTKCAFARVLL